MSFLSKNITAQGETYGTVPAFASFLTHKDTVKSQIWHTLVEDILERKFKYDDSLSLQTKKESVFESTGITILDSFSMIEIDEEKTIQMIESITGKNINIIEKNGKGNEFDNEIISNLNEIMNESIDFYEKELLFKVPDFIFTQYNGNKTERKIRFNSKKDILRFIEQTFKNEKAGVKQIHCDLLKICYVTASMKKYPELKKLDKDLVGIIGAKLSHLLKEKTNKSEKIGENDEEILEGIGEMEFMTKSYEYPIDKDILNNDINFTLTARSKSGISGKIKMIYNPGYDQVDLIKDLLGIRAEVKTSKDAIILLQYIYYNFFKGKGEIIDKGIMHQENNGISKKEFLEENKEYISLDFFNKLMKSKSNSGKSSGNYQDIKIVGQVEYKGQMYSIEFQIVLVGNNNESGYSHHAIFDLKKRIEACIRLRGYITYNHIIRHIRKIFIDSPEISKVLGIEKEEKFIENMVYHLLNEGNLLELDIPKQNNQRRYYTTIGRWNSLNFIKRDIHPSVLKCIRQIKNSITKENLSEKEVKNIINNWLMIDNKLLKLGSGRNIMEQAKSAIENIYSFIVKENLFYFENGIVSLVSSNHLTKRIKELNKSHRFYPDGAQVKHPIHTQDKWTKGKVKKSRTIK